MRNRRKQKQNSMYNLSFLFLVRDKKTHPHTHTQKKKNQHGSREFPPSINTLRQKTSNHLQNFPWQAEENHSSLKQ